jgi:glycosyltransferase involved in cell wall biosynthesis
MATYNGERFIHQQIASILRQLHSEDEVIIVDDASSDGTVAILEGLCDNRIRIIPQPRNRGIVKSFGRALGEARGELIFLADQDDIWQADKVSKIKGLFSTDPDLSLVQSNCSIIDADGKVIAERRFKSREFYPGALQNLVRNLYQGSTMAFRSSILEYCLPFPADIPMHDMWIGIVNQFVGKAAFIDEPLISYRRHGRNESPEKHASFAQMIRWRWALVKNLASLYARRTVLKRRGGTILSQ